MAALKNTHGFAKGNPGKPKGAVTKVTKELKEMILEALTEAGGVEYLKAKAQSNPAAFIALIGKILPLQVNGSGENGEIIVKIIRYSALET